MPIRIQRKRTKGWKMPPNTVYVGRPSKWGNPYRPTGGVRPIETIIQWYLDDINGDRFWGNPIKFTKEEIKKELRGKNLACWCPLDQPCHADVLLEIANSLNNSTDSKKP